MHHHPQPRRADRFDEHREAVVTYALDHLWIGIRSNDNGWRIEPQLGAHVTHDLVALKSSVQAVVRYDQVRTEFSFMQM